MIKRQTYTGTLLDAGILSGAAWAPVFELIKIAGNADLSFLVLFTDVGYVCLNSELCEPVAVNRDFRIDLEADSVALGEYCAAALPARVLPETAGKLAGAYIRDPYGNIYGVVGCCCGLSIDVRGAPEKAVEAASSVAAGLCRAFLPMQSMEDTVEENGRQNLLNLVEDLEASNSRLQSVLESVPSAVIVIDDIGGIIRFNEYACVLFGDEHREMETLTIEDLLQDSVEKVKEREPAQVLGRRRSGEVFPALVQKASRQLNDGVLETALTVTDISELNEMRAEARHAREEFEQLIHAVHVPIITIDLHGFVTNCNAEAAALLGLSSEEVVGADFPEQFMNPESQSAVKHLFDRLDAGEDLHNLELSLVTANDERRQVLASVTVRRDSEGKPLERIAIGQDITEIRLKENLLRQSQKMETLGELTSGIAHDFNNLLNILTGNLRYLGSLKSDNPEYDEVVEDSLSAAGDAGDLIGRLMAFSRQNFEDAEEKFSIAEALGKVQKVTQRLFRKHVYLDVTPVDSNLVVHADPVWFESSVLNLMNNARDAMAESGGTVVISAESVWLNRVTAFDLRAGHYVKVSVEDTGPGVPEVLRDRIFDPFFSTKSQDKGTGLGLAMVFRFCQRAGGFCELDRNYTRGAKFNLYLPLNADNAEYGEPAIPASSDESAEEGCRVLVVEDDDRVRRVMIRDLKSIGMRCDESSSADEAIQLLSADQNFSLVLSDVMMPGQNDGFDLAEWIAKQYPELPVLLASAYAGKPGLRAAGADFIAKPYDINELERRVRNLTSRSGQQSK